SGLRDASAAELAMASLGLVEIQHGIARIGANEECQRPPVRCASRASVLAEYRGPTVANLDPALDEHVLIVARGVGPRLLAFSQGILGPVAPGIRRRRGQADFELLPGVVVQRRRMSRRCRQGED